MRSALQLVVETSYQATTIEGIATRAGVSKATIYRWWPGKGSVIIDAFLARIAPQIPFPPDQNLRESIRHQMRLVIKLMRSPMGSLLRQLIGAAQSDPELFAAMRDRWLLARRTYARPFVQAALDSGELRPGVDGELMLDALYAPLYLRLLFAHQPLHDGLADELVDQVFPAFARPTFASAGLASSSHASPATPHTGQANAS